MPRQLRRWQRRWQRTKRTAEEYRQEVERLQRVNAQIMERLEERLDYATATTMAEAPIRRTPNMRMVRADVAGFHLQAMLPDNDEAVSRWLQDFMLPQMEGLNPYEKVEFSQQTLMGREIL